MNSSSLKVRTNGILRITLSFSSDCDWSEGSNAYSMTIGYNDGIYKSMNGYVWDFIISNFEILDSIFCSTTSPTTYSCLVEKCPSSCVPSIISEGISYCISEVKESEKLGTGDGCSKDCADVGCFYTKDNCLDCLCAYGSCVLSSSKVSQCWCPSDANSTPTGCKCNSGVYDGIYSCEIITCGSECSFCLTSNIEICTFCIALNAIPTQTGGCKCNDRFYNVTALNTIDACKPCNSDCATCNDENLCLNCIADNSLPSKIKGCTCIDAFYYDADFDKQNSCRPCNADCATCYEQDICLSCKAKNASPYNKGCKCFENYYNDSMLSLADCKICNEECATCNEANTCLTCVTNNAIPSDTIGCVCKDKYYKSGLFTDKNGCSSCNIDCATCENEESCLTCIEPNAEKKLTGCACKDGYYASSTNPLVCSICDDLCLKCIENSICVSCLFEFSNIESGICHCPLYSSVSQNKCECNEGYYLKKLSNGKYSCKKCHETCKACTSSTFCISCANNTNTLTATGECHVTCSAGYYNKDETCLSCLNLCNDCSDNLSCNFCVTNAHMINSPSIKCSCDTGYYQSGRKCKVNYFGAKISVNRKNRIIIQFDEELAKDLIKENFEISIEGIESFTYSVKKNDFKSFYLPLKFTEDVKDGTDFNLTITKSLLKSKTGKILEKYIYFGKLYEFLAISKVLVTMANNTKAVTQIVVSSSIGSAFISNPSAVWSIINTIQLISYIPLNSNPIPDRLKSFVKGLGSYTEIIPNPFTNIFDSRTLSDPYLQARKFGTNTSVFWINIGPSMITFLFIVSMWPFLSLISNFKLGKFSVKIKKILKNYRYNFFLRFWIQAYLDIGVAALIQLRSVISI